MDVVAHLDEIFLKGGNQPYFCRLLARNLKLLFRGVRVRRIDKGTLRLSGLEAGKLPQLSGVPGIANLAPAVFGGYDLAEIKKSIEQLSFSPASKTFRVTAARSDKRYPLTSRELEVVIGDYIRQKRHWAVDLKNADAEVRIDVNQEGAIVYNSVIDGAGGLPTGSVGRVLCLISGGLDSPVAAYQLMKRGAEVSLIHFQNQTRATEEVAQKIMDLAAALARYQPAIDVCLVPFAGWQRQIVMKIPAAYRMIVTRRLMFRLAEKTAEGRGILALATGDSLGQVASQTLENMLAIQAAVQTLKLCPLVGMNKVEIMKMARKIGTMEISSRPYEDCCSLFVARHPQTRARLNDVLAMEKAIDTSGLDDAEARWHRVSAAAAI